MNVFDLDQIASEEIKKYNSGVLPESLLKSLNNIDILLFRPQHAPLIAQLNSLIHRQTIKASYYKVLQMVTAQVPARDLMLIKPDFVVTQNNQTEREKIFEIIKTEQAKNHQISVKKTEVIKKGEELESFNLLLSKESEKKIELIRKFLEIEEGRKKTEKKLLYFLDLINLEIAKPSFLQSVLSFLWKENSCSDFAMMVGFQLEQSDNDFTVFFDGKEEKVFYEKKLDFRTTAQLEPHRQLANVLKRPTAHLQVFHLEMEKRRFQFFYEIKNSDPNLLKQKNIFFQDRLSILAMATSNWLIDHKIKIQFEIWDYIFKNWEDPVHLIDNQFRLIKSNYQNDVDATSSEFYCYKVLAGLDQPCIGCPVQENKSQGSVSFHEKRYQAVRSVYQNEAKTMNLVFYQDKTSADLLKKEFIQSEKLKLLGQLSNHLSHELNNPLTGLKLQAEFFLQQSDPQKYPTLHEDFLQIVDGLKRSIDIIHDLQSFTGNNGVQQSDQDIAKTINSVLRLLKSITREVRLFIDVKKFSVLTNPGLLQQTLYNLIKNSCEALQFKGTVKIYSAETAEAYTLIIEDDGPGLPELVKANLFKPFISTKESKGGTGLGLFISYESCKKMNIDFSYDASFKNGTRFKLGFKK